MSEIVFQVLYLEFQICIILLFNQSLRISKFLATLGSNMTPPYLSGPLLFLYILYLFAFPAHRRYWDSWDKKKQRVGELLCYEQFAFSHQGS